MYRVLFFLLFSGLIFSSCEDDSESEGDDCLLYGTWTLSYVESDGDCQFACASENSLPGDCDNITNYGSCLTVTINDDGSFNGSDGTGSQGGTWTGDCSQGAPVSATMMDGTQLNGSIVTVSANELSINSDGSIYVFDK